MTIEATIDATNFQAPARDVADARNWRQFLVELRRDNPDRDLDPQRFTGAVAGRTFGAALNLLRFDPAATPTYEAIGAIAVEAQHWRSFLAQLKAAGAEPATTGRLAGQAYVALAAARPAPEPPGPDEKPTLPRKQAQQWRDFEFRVMSGGISPSSGKAAAQLLLDAIHTIARDPGSLRHFERAHHPTSLEYYRMQEESREWRALIEELYAGGYHANVWREPGQGIAKALLKLRADSIRRAAG